MYVHVPEPHRLAGIAQCVFNCSSSCTSSSGPQVDTRKYLQMAIADIVSRIHGEEELRRGVSIPGFTYITNYLFTNHVVTLNSAHQIDIISLPGRKTSNTNFGIVLSASYPWTICASGG
jgi:hypothetical protein